jgi:hypothetical protein
VPGVVEARQLGALRRRRVERDAADALPGPVGGDGGERLPVGPVEDELAVERAAGREPVAAQAGDLFGGERDLAAARPRLRGDDRVAAVSATDGSSARLTWTMPVSRSSPSGP